MVKYTYIENNSKLKKLYELVEKVKIFAFDCEFDKKSEYNKTLSIISVNVKNQFFIIDCINTDFYQGFIKILSNKEIRKITHSGQSDYDIFLRKSKTLPLNTIDTQILALFCNLYGPLDLKSLIREFLEIEIEKDMSATDWKKRPLTTEQLNYAIIDVEYLIDLSEAILEKLHPENKKWAFQMCTDLSNEDTYKKNPLYELLSTRELGKYNKQEIIFLIRITEWQSKLVTISKNEIFKPRLISDLLRTVNSGKDTMLQDTRIKKSMIMEHLDKVLDMYHKEPTEKELAAYESLFRDRTEKIKRNNALDFIELLIKEKCYRKNIVYKTLLSKKDLNLMKNIKGYTNTFLEKSWKKEIVGEEIVSLIDTVDDLNIEYSENKIEIKFKQNRR